MTREPDVARKIVIEDEAERPRAAGGRTESSGDDTLTQALIGAGAVVAAAGVAFAVGKALTSRDPNSGSTTPGMSDAPEGTWKGGSTDDAGNALAARTVTIGKPRQELYAFWREFANLPQFMDNVERVEIVDEERQRWVIKAPAGSNVEFVNRIVEDRPGEVIAWESEPGASVPNSGRIEFTDAPEGRGTYVRALITYDPPGGPVGRLAAKVLQREPKIQARRDLRRFKQLMETGEVTTSASPSGRKSEDPVKQYA